MAFRHIHITGPSGSGTTTLGHALAERLQWPVLDADDYYWLPTTPPFQQKREKTERLSRLLHDYQVHPTCIVSGSMVDWNEALEQSFDLIIYLWIPADIRLERLRRRELEKLGSIDEEFMAWAASYDTGDITIRSRARHENWMAKLRCPILRLEDDFSVEERVARVMALIANHDRQAGGEGALFPSIILPL